MERQRPHRLPGSAGLLVGPHLLILGTSLASPSAAVNSPPAPNTGVADVAAADGTIVTGPPIDTRYGTVQVQLTVSGSKITAARTLQAPDGNGRDSAIDQAHLS
jgi:uncharacterized protein with FMN-binding domain